MIVWGSLITQRAVGPSARSIASALCWRLNWIGIALALYIFMADALRSVHRGVEATRTVLPTDFDWPMFVVALTLMAAPVAHIAWRMRPLNLLDIPARSSRGRPARDGA
jgi:hypothetical protein